MGQERPDPVEVCEDWLASLEEVHSPSPSTIGRWKLKDRELDEVMPPLGPAIEMIDIVLGGEAK